MKVREKEKREKDWLCVESECHFTNNCVQCTTAAKSSAADRNRTNEFVCHHSSFAIYFSMGTNTNTLAFFLICLTSSTTTLISGPTFSLFQLLRIDCGLTDWRLNFQFLFFCFFCCFSVGTLSCSAFSICCCKIKRKLNCCFLFSIFDSF